MLVRLELSPTLTSGLRMSGKIANHGLEAMPYFNVEIRYQSHMLVIGNFALKDGFAYSYGGGRWIGKRQSFSPTRSLSLEDPNRVGCCFGFNPTSPNSAREIVTLYFLAKTRCHGLERGRLEFRRLVWGM